MNHAWVLSLALLLNTVASAGPLDHQDIVRLVKDGTYDPRIALFFKQATDPSATPEIRAEAVKFFSTRARGKNLRNVDGLLRNYIIKTRDRMKPVEFEAIVRGWLRFDQAMQVSYTTLDLFGTMEESHRAFFDLERLSEKITSTPLQSIFIKVLAEEAHAGTLATVLHTALAAHAQSNGNLNDSFLSKIGGQTVAHLREADTKNLEMIRSALSVDSQQTQQAILRGLQTHPPFGRAYEYSGYANQLISLAAHSRSEQMAQYRTVLLQSPHLNAAMMPPTGEEYHPDLAKLLFGNEPGSHDLADIYNLKLRKHPGTLEAVVPAVLFKEKGSRRFTSQLFSGQVVTPSQRKKIDLSGVPQQLIDAAFIELTAIEMLTAVTSPDSLYFDRVDLFDRSIQLAQNALPDWQPSLIDTMYSLNNPYAYLEDLPDKNIALPPKLAKRIGSKTLTAKNLAEYTAKTSLVHKHLHDWDAKKFKIPSPEWDARVKEVLASVPPEDLIWGLFGKEAVKDLKTNPRWLKHPEVIERILLRERIGGIAVNGYFNESFGVLFALFPPHGETTQWNHHPEFLSDPTKRVTSQDVIERLLNEKRSFYPPKTEAHDGCLAAILRQVE